ncbi:DUF4083 family protein [Peribacillus butanolivorans]|uniref:DUF4083 family protein n=1 Tax=Peribacillus butanolivorans TaxID=421767 RepID=UPI0037C5FABB
MSSFNMADMIYQLFCFVFLILIIVGIVSFFRSVKQRKTRLDIMEKKMDDLYELIKKDSD